MHLSLNENEFVRFISDLHLTPDEARLETFYDFLDTLPKSCRGLFILGDFFDHWLGQDIHDTEYNKLATKLSSVGCPVMFLPGNRDFLVEDLWLKKANVKRKAFKFGDINKRLKFSYIVVVSWIDPL